MNAVDTYTLVLESTINLAGVAAVEVTATNIGNGKAVEAILSTEQVLALLNYSYGGEREIIDSYMDQILSHRPVLLTATAKDRLLLAKRELVNYGFDRANFEPREVGGSFLV